MNIITLKDISNERIKRIKEIVKFHYDLELTDEDIKTMDKMLTRINTQSTLHDQRIINNFVTQEIRKNLLKYRDKIGSINYERILMDKLIFHFLSYADNCYDFGIPIASISLCRTALEAGLRERLAEVMAKKESTNASKIPKLMWKYMRDLQKDDLTKLISKAKKERIIKNEFEKIFQNLKFKTDESRRILDKFIHGDMVWITDFVSDREDTRVIGAQNILDEKKIIMISAIDKIAVEVLKGTTKIAEILYFKNNFKNL